MSDKSEKILVWGETAANQGAISAPAAAIGHGAFPVKLTKTLDSSKLKMGDPVELETAGSFKLPEGTLVPKGSKLTGHVTATTARSKGDSTSQLSDLRQAKRSGREAAFRQKNGASSVSTAGRS